MEYFKLVMIISILAFFSFSAGILGRNFPDHANDQFTSTSSPLLPVESASMAPVTIRISSFFRWTKKNLFIWFLTNIPKGPYDGTDSSCKNHITVANLGRPSRPSEPPPRPPPGPRPVSNIELPFSKKPPQKLNLESA